MRTVVQLSDLHFGAILEPTLEPLVEQLRELSPDLTIISGDVSQRARSDEFARARDYLKRLPTPQLVIPGNHDVPLYNVFRRFLSPLDCYDEYIASNHDPVFIDDEIAVVAINSARSFTFKGGNINEAQIRNSVQQFDRANKQQVRIVVTHHPFDLPVGLSGVSIVHGAKEAIQAFARSDVDLFLTGHLHLIHRATGAVFVPGYKATLLGAGTATSTRARGESNSFFVFRIDHTLADENAIQVETHSWNAARNCFEITDTRGLHRTSAAYGHGSGITA
ncbi:MAG: metallophosphoesterase [Gemmatimonadaceae bacterium]